MTREPPGRMAATPAAKWMAAMRPTTSAPSTASRKATRIVPRTPRTIPPAGAKKKTAGVFMARCFFLARPSLRKGQCFEKRINAEVSHLWRICVAVCFSMEEGNGRGNARGAGLYNAAWRVLPWMNCSDCMKRRHHQPNILTWLATVKKCVALEKKKLTAKQCRATRWVLSLMDTLRAISNVKKRGLSPRPRLLGSIQMTR